MSTDHAREVAERIARRVSRDAGQNYEANAPNRSGLSSELAAVRTGLNDLQRKISQLEARLNSETTASPQTYSDTSRPVPLTHSPWLAGVNASVSHPSEERFGVDEAVVTQLVDHFEKEKTCSLEPGGKPCDHCAMCSSRGF